MSATVVIGAQWGDEGKAKIIDRYAENADGVVRFNGANNAGHTIVVNGEKTVQHLLPVGIVRGDTWNAVGPLVGCDLEVAVEELAIAERTGADVFLDHSAPVILPIHRAIDGGREAAAGEGAIGTTKRGVGPVFEDYWSRRGVQLGDLVSDARVGAALEAGGYYEERRAVATHLGVSSASPDETVDWCMAHANRIIPLLGDTRSIVAERLDNHDRVLFEGAQGVLLDRAHSGSQYCTSSFCTAAAVSASFGIYEFDRVVGVAKAYLTRVGGGPFPTELDNELGAQIREKGKEFGATTGRPRRCGWLDLVALRYACRVGGITRLAITKLDVLSGLPSIKVCTEYERRGIAISSFTTLTGKVLAEVTPIYETLEGWTEDISSCMHRRDLPQAAQDYLSMISQYARVPIDDVSVGPDRAQMFRW